MLKIMGLDVDALSDGGFDVYVQMLILYLMVVLAFLTSIVVDVFV